MPAYKYRLKSGAEKWYCAFYAEEGNGNSRKVKKMGFDRKKDAQEWERKYLENYKFHVGLPFSALYDAYIKDATVRLRPTTLRTRIACIEAVILPFFGSYPVDSITPIVVREWQNKLLQSDYSETYIHALNAHLSTIFNFAKRFYGLSDNPCRLAGRVGSSRAREMSIWTPEQFLFFLKNAKLREDQMLAFNVLFWSGLRSGELLALTWGDVENGELCITKALSRVGKEDIIAPPKTHKSIRRVSIPSWLEAAIFEHKKKHYQPSDSDRIFAFGHNALYRILQRRCAHLGIRSIRLHDLRHSHASMLVHLNVNPLAISRRLGHESVETTLNTYSHLYPDADRSIAAGLGDSTFLVPSEKIYWQND